MHIKYPILKKIPQSHIVVGGTEILSLLLSKGYYQKLDFITDSSSAFAVLQKPQRCQRGDQDEEENDQRLS